MTRFVTNDHDVAKRLRVAHLTGRLITGTAGDISFTQARVHSVKRDFLSRVGSWTIEIEQDLPEST